ncbi:MAG: hypothetical protein ABIT23_04920 [Nitrosospira sp.]
MNKADMNDLGKAWLSKGITTLATTIVGGVGSQVAGMGEETFLALIGSLSPIAGDYIARNLSLKENERVNTVADLAIRGIHSNIAAGMELRRDDFFKTKGIRPAAEEIFEGILNIARSEHEESKLPYLANLYASIPFDNSISRGEANRLIQQLELLTYRKICILALISEESGYKGLREKCINNTQASAELAILMQDCFELENQGLLTQVDYGQSPSYGAHSWAFVVPALLRIARPGSKLIALAKLCEIPEFDVQHIRQVMNT